MNRGTHTTSLGERFAISGSDRLNCYTLDGRDK